MDVTTERPAPPALTSEETAVRRITAAAWLWGGGTPEGLDRAAAVIEAMN
jgi:hypothetical protein